MKKKNFELQSEKKRNVKEQKQAISLNYIFQL